MLPTTASQTPFAPDPTPVPGLTPHILVVEDDADLAAAIGDVLEAAGYHVALAGNGLEALVLMRSGLRPDLILLDLMMPVMDGWGFAAERSKLPGGAAIPLIAVTADGNARRKAEEIRANGYLAKPVAIRVLLDTIRRVFASDGTPA